MPGPADPVIPHTRDTLTRSRRSNAALGGLPDHPVAHFADQVQLPGNAPLLLRVTAPALRPGELLDRLVLTAIYLPRQHRAAGLERRRRPLRAGRHHRPASWRPWGWTIPSR